MIPKAEIIAACIAQIEVNRSALLTQKNDLQESQRSDTKSSAGDKHETSREMAAQEIGKLDSALANLAQMQQDIERIDSEELHPTIRIGSVVKTKNATFFIAAALGKVSCQEMAIMVISAAAPLARTLFGKCAADSVAFNGVTHEVLSVA